MNQEQLDAFLLEIKAVCEKHGLFFRDNGYESDTVIDDREGNLVGFDVNLDTMNARLFIPDADEEPKLTPEEEEMNARLTAKLQEKMAAIKAERDRLAREQSEWQENTKIVFGDDDELIEETVLDKAKAWFAGVSESDLKFMRISESDIIEMYLQVQERKKALEGKQYVCNGCFTVYKEMPNNCNICGYSQFQSEAAIKNECCSKQELVDNGTYKHCKSCGVVQKGKPVMTPTGFHACPKCGNPTVAQGQYCSVECATTG